MRYWIAFAIFVLLLYAVRSILPPFVIALVLAYVFVPGIDFIGERFKWPRTLVVLASRTEPDAPALDAQTCRR